MTEMDVPMDMDVPQRFDFLAKLSGKQLYLVMDVIFQHLEPQDVKSVELVSSGWKRIVATGKYWEQLLKRKVRESERWKDVLAYIQAKKPSLLQELHGAEHKKACFLIAFLLTPKFQKVEFKGEFGCDLDFKVIRQGYRHVWGGRNENDETMELSLPKLARPGWPTFNNWWDACLSHVSAPAKVSVSRDGKFEGVCQLISVVDSKLAAGKFLRIIRQIGYPARLQKCQICRVIGSWYVEYGIRLLDLMGALGLQHCTYRTDEFQSRVYFEYEMDQPKVSFTISSGASSTYIQLSAKSEKKMLKAFKIIYPVLRQYRNPQQ